MDGELITSLFLLEDVEYCLQGEAGRAREEEPEETLVGTAAFRLGPDGEQRGVNRPWGFRAGLKGCRGGGGAKDFSLLLGNQHQLA